MSDVSSKDHIQKSLDGTDRQGFFITQLKSITFYNSRKFFQLIEHSSSLSPN